ncbi:hypothetical protein SELMODRAFT_118492 [Selaginella moellendorffii]|uniref:Pentacotripeptide-repeat region of PRORP domain-containing protein n=1 Tax=Selaginella moellendorffii TaxID=88036 RepID=D8SJJ1_SELML|nr:hypothetical protein SELMODRAFT_118492 [Selaginella moellendorffii]
MIAEAEAQDHHQSPAPPPPAATPLADASVYASLLRRCGDAGAIAEGRRVHAHIVKHGFDRDILVANSIIQMYGSCGCNGHLQESRALFDSMVDRSSVSWNAMISAYAQSAQFEAALHLFRLMNHDGCLPDRSTFVNALGACCELTALQFGRMIHAQIAESGLERECMVATALINLHGKCGNLEGARAVFDLMEERTIISWTAMITAYSQNGQIVLARQFFDRMPHWCVISGNTLISAYSRGRNLREALRVFGAMESPSSGLVPNEHSYMAVLESCGKLGALAEGREIHARIAKRGFDACDLVAASLIEMYGRCGSVDEAVAVLDQTRSLGRSVWSAAICALGQNGIGGAALGLLQRMQLQGIEVDASSTFVSLLAACSHGGMLREGVELFRSMVGDFGVEPVLEHFLCLVDLLGRAGQLDRALELVTSMPYQADAVAWVSLLSACSVHADKARGALATSSLLEIDRSDAASYCQFVFL